MHMKKCRESILFIPEINVQCMPRKLEISLRYSSLNWICWMSLSSILFIPFHFLVFLFLSSLSSSFIPFHFRNAFNMSKQRERQRFFSLTCNAFNDNIYRIHQLTYGKNALDYSHYFSSVYWQIVMSRRHHHYSFIPWKRF